MVRVLFISGFGRSGSTLLDRLLGQNCAFHSGGEIDSTWDLGVRDERLCSCGASFSACPFWQAVAQVAPDTLSPQSAQKVLVYWNSVSSARSLWRLCTGGTRQRMFDAAPGGYFSHLQLLYEALIEVSGRQVLVDSSKHATYLSLLAQVPDIELRVVHLVRDPRAVTHSWQRSRVRDPDGRTTMPRFGILKASVLWLAFNLALEHVVRSLRLPCIRVRYEDLVNEPDGVLAMVGRFAWGSRAGLPARTGGSSDHIVMMRASHLISGNPMRFEQDDLRVTEDTSWHTDPAVRRWAVAGGTLPLLWRYGYRLRAPSQLGGVG